MSRSRLRGAIDCGDLRHPPACEAAIDDLAVTRLDTSYYDQRWMVGVVTAARADGAVRAVATARKPHRTWRYGHTVAVGKQAKLAGMRAEQIALALPKPFESLEAAKAAVVQQLRKGGLNHDPS